MLQVDSEGDTEEGVHPLRKFDETALCLHIWGEKTLSENTLCISSHGEMGPVSSWRAIVTNTGAPLTQEN